MPPSHTSIGALRSFDHYLLDHYKTFVWRGFVVRDDAATNTLHQDIVPRLGVSHSFLLYAMLSMAATDSNEQNPNKDVEKQALVYRQKTFESYKEALKDITADNYEAVLVTGSLLLAIAPAPSSHDDEGYLDWMFSMLKLNEGLRILAGLRWSQGIEKLSVYPLVRRELRILPPPPVIDTGGLEVPIGPLGTTPVTPNPAPTYTASQLPRQTRLFLPPPLMSLLESIVQANKPGPVDWHRATLMPVFHVLSPIFLSLYYHHLNPDFYVRIYVFTSFLMPEFLQLVREREPRALVLVAWWLALAGLVPKGWWLGNRVRRVVGAIVQVVQSKDNDVAKVAIKGAKKIVETSERKGREEAAKGLFEGWSGVCWDEGPDRAEAWEFAESVNLVCSKMSGALSDGDFDLQEFDLLA